MLYFDHAATSYPKPPAVLAEMQTTLKYRGGNPSRGGHVLSMAAGRILFRTRVALGNHFGTSPEKVILTPSCTYSLNFAMKSTLLSGDHFLISNVEHNAVRRPATALLKSHASYSTFDALLPKEKLLCDIHSKLRVNTKAIVCTYTANTVPITLPIPEIGALCREKGIYFIVDAAQSAGHFPIDMQKCGIDALCLAGHKGLLGPQGCGALLVSEKFASYLINAPTLIEGGSGIASLEEEMPRSLPERFEAGTPGTVCVSGLLAGIETLEKIGYPYIMEHEEKIYRKLQKGLLSIPQITVYAPELSRGSTLLFNYKDIACDEAGRRLDERGVCVRYGYHCAPMAHRVLGTGEGGAIRIGIGILNTEREADELLEILWQIGKKGNRVTKG